MPRYYFHVQDGVSMPDRVGTELVDWSQARIEAIQLAGQILRDDAPTIAMGEDWHLDVTDEFGLVLFRFDFISHEAAALSSHKRRLSRPS
ncbi:DUF6894 family protein [Methylobacterium sp. NPDC080182]|uniref:DUF6894 family protein n=1 Tax=Methylobacterium sp. NPDC080182 TaxID=3390590 RepID=UPI003D024A77